MKILLSFFPTLLLCSTSLFLTSGARINLSFFLFPFPPLPGQQQAVANMYTIGEREGGGGLPSSSSNSRKGVRK
ncbi:hypothetical protein B9Z19DRAFT_1080553 [Tuber borchii]|uniref:Secreted protein n=1 Tax=Tuber borchii TaxID=42251 RepID=A0A2T6ZWY4_TUBBO|nr:hypothetical protein B9Z19DRAFT_1080553 [Tuber borchii]